MALCGRNISLHLHKSMDYLVIAPVTWESTLKNVLSICIYIYTYIYIWRDELWSRMFKYITATEFGRLRVLVSCLCFIRHCRYLTNALAWFVPPIERLYADFPQWRPGFDLMSDHVGFVVGQSGIGDGFLRVIRCPLPVIPSAAPRSSPSGASTIYPIVTGVPSGLGHATS
jgi:hypothetical protein